MFGVARFGTSSPVLDLFHPRSFTSPQGLSCMSFALVAFNLLHIKSTSTLHSSMNLDLSMFAFGLTCFGLSLSVPGLCSLGSSAAFRSSSCIGAVLLPSDSTWAGSLLPLQFLAHPGSVVPVTGSCRTGSSLPSLERTNLSSLPFLRSPA